MITQERRMTAFPSSFKGSPSSPSFLQDLDKEKQRIIEEKLSKSKTKKDETKKHRRRMTAMPGAGAFSSFGKDSKPKFLLELESKKRKN